VNGDTFSTTRSRRCAVAAVVLVQAASILLLAACTSEGNGASPDGSVVASSLYQDSSGSKSEASASGDASATLPVLSKDDSIPPGQTGEIVPTVGALLGDMTPQQKLLLNTAYYLVVKKCMIDQGFTLLDPPPKLETVNSGPILFDGYIGILDVDYAKKYGYQVFAGTVTDSDKKGQQRVIGDPKYEEALKVAGNDGCDGEADRMIEKNVPSEDASTPVLATIYQDSLNATYADPTYKQVLQLWSTCMKNAGFDYASPENAFRAFGGFQVTAESAVSRSLPQPSTAEVNTAVTDVGCKRSSRLADVFRKTLWDRQLAMAATNRPVLKVIEEARSQKLENAQGIIKAYG